MFCLLSVVTMPLSFWRLSFFNFGCHGCQMSPGSGFAYMGPKSIGDLVAEAQTGTALLKGAAAFCFVAAAGLIGFGGYKLSNPSTERR